MLYLFAVMFNFEYFSVRFTSTDEQEPSTSRHGNHSICQLPDFMEGVHVYFHGMSPHLVKKQTRYLIAYPLLYVVIYYYKN